MRKLAVTLIAAYTALLAALCLSACRSQGKIETTAERPWTHTAQTKQTTTAHEAETTVCHTTLIYDTLDRVTEIIEKRLRRGAATASTAAARVDSTGERRTDKINNENARNITHDNRKIISKGKAMAMAVAVVAISVAFLTLTNTGRL